MPECLSLLRARGGQPRLFFSLCFLFSFVIVGVSVYFFYYSDDSEFTHNYEFEQHSRRPGLKSQLHGKKLQESSDGEDEGIDQVLKNMDLNQNHEVEKQESRGEEEYINPPPKLRHHAHHHGKPVLSIEELEQKPLLSRVIENRFLHFDLKGAPPKLSYLKEVLKLAKRAGINGLLLEWEDTFPWSKSLANLSLSEGGYSREEAEELVNFAEIVLDFEVIPLVQTFGHVEFVLKGQDFRHLREVDQDPQAFCPSKPGTMGVIREMIDQILELHPRSRFVHIGCDEVYNLRVCPVCKEAFEYREDLFLNHVQEVASYVKGRGKQPLIWDDMLRVISLRRLNESGIGSLVEPMIWVYAEDVDRFVGWDSWEKYAEVFPVIWGAAAFKGAFGETLSIPPLSRHADNVNRWINVISRESPKWELGTGGLVLTGWMRYDHFSVLCELLPGAIPSLIYNSLQISIPSSTSSVPIKNRVFQIPNSDKKDSPNSNNLLPPSSSEKPSVLDPSINQSQDSYLNISPSSSPSSPVLQNNALQIRKRSAPGYHRPISHPRILMAKDRLARLVTLPPTGSRSRELPTGDITYDKHDIISREFSAILHCPNYHTRLDVLLKSSDKDLGFASRCNFSGVAYFRSLFRLKAVIQESYELINKIERSRGWLTPYNIRHNYSLPLRVDEVLADVPRLRKQIEITEKGIESALKPIFRQEIILEWMEQNVWEVWKKLKHLENAGEKLKHVNVWPRRPVQSPWEMVQDLKLSRVEFDEL